MIAINMHEVFFPKKTKQFFYLLWPKSQPRLFPNPRVFLTFISWTMSPMVSWSTCAGHACYAAGRLQGGLGGATAMQEEEEGLYRRAPPRSDNDSLSLPEAAQEDKKTTEWDCMGRYIAIHRRKRWLGLRGRFPSGGRCSNQSFWRPSPGSQLGGWDGQAFNTHTTPVLTTGGYYRQGHKTQKCVYRLFICFQSKYVCFCAFSECVGKNNCEDRY